MIDGAVFEYATNLVHVDLSRSKVQSIGNYCFYLARKLESVLMNDMITSISEKSFANCASLKRLALSPRLKTVSETSFDNTDQLTKFIFCGLNDLTTPIIKSNVEVIVSNKYQSDTFGGLPIIRMTNVCNISYPTIGCSKKIKSNSLYIIIF